MKSTRLETLSQGSLGEEANVATGRGEMLVEIERNDEQVLEPPMIWSGKQSQTVSYEEAMNLTNEPPDIEEMFDDFCAEADVK